MLTNPSSKNSDDSIIIGEPEEVIMPKRIHKLAEKLFDSISHEEQKNQ